MEGDSGGVVHEDRGGDRRSDRHMDRGTSIRVGDIHGNKRGRDEPVIDGWANKGLRGMKRRLDGTTNRGGRERWSEQKSDSSKRERLCLEELRVERSCFLERQKRRVKKDQEKERRERCIHSDRLSYREPSAHPDTLNWHDPQC